MQTHCGYGWLSSISRFHHTLHGYFDKVDKNIQVKYLCRHTLEGLMPSAKIGYLISVALVSSLISCSTFSRDARKYELAREWESARSMWLRVLERSPNDVDALIGKKRAEEEIINERLVGVTRARESNDFATALQRMEELLRQTADWHYKLDYYSASFQAKELALEWKELSARTNGLIFRNQPWNARLLLADYASIFASVPEVERQSVVFKLTKLTEEYCQRYVQNIACNGPKSAALVQKICGLHLPKLKLQNIAMSNGEERDRFKVHQVNLQVDGLPSRFNDKLREAVFLSFSHSDWYKQEGEASVDIGIGGAFSFIDRAEVVELEQEYYKSVPYTAYQPKMETRQVPYQTTEYQCTYRYPTGTICGNVSVTKYRTAYDWVQVPVTKYQQVREVYPYLGEEVTYSGNVSLSINFSSDQALIPSKAISNSVKKSEIVHRVSMPSIKLYPVTERTFSQEEWVSSVAAEVTQGLDQHLKGSWRNYVCRKFKDNVKAANASEFALRCREADDGREQGDLSIVDGWFKAKFGIEYDNLAKAAEFDISQ